MFKKRVQRAVAMVSILTIIFVVSMLAGIVAISVTTSLRTNQQTDLKKTARYAAYAGTQRALLEIKNNPSNTTFPGYNVTLPNDPNSGYQVNITTNLNFVAGNATILYAPDSTQVPPGMVYIQAAGEAHSMTLSADSTLATMGKTGQVRWDQAARLTNFIYGRDTSIVDLNNSTNPDPANYVGTATNALVTVCENTGGGEVLLDGQSTIYGNLQLPYNCGTGTSFVNVTGRSGSPALPAVQAQPFLPGPTPDTSMPRNTVPKFGPDPSLDFGAWFPVSNPLPSSNPSATSYFSSGTVYDSVTADYAGSSSNVVTLPSGRFGVRGDILINGANIVAPTGANCLLYFKGNCLIANSTINWGRAAAPYHDPLALQFFSTRGKSPNRKFALVNCTGDFVLGGKFCEVQYANNTVVVGAVMSDSLALIGNSSLHYDMNQLVNAPVQAPMLVDVMGQKSDLAQGSAFTYTYTCFVATAAHGDRMAPDVVTLRQFRDDVLLKTAPGQAFVESYYHYSPPLARAIEGSPLLQTLVRAALSPIVFAARYPFAAAVAVFAFLYSCLVFRLQVRRLVRFAWSGE